MQDGFLANYRAELVLLVVVFSWFSMCCDSSEVSGSNDVAH